MTRHTTHTHNKPYRLALVLLLASFAPRGGALCGARRLLRHRTRGRARKQLVQRHALELRRFTHLARKVRRLRCLHVLQLRLMRLMLVMVMEVLLFLLLMLLLL